MADISATAKYTKRHAALNTVYASWKPEYIELSEHLLPRLGRFFTSDVNKGSKSNKKIINPAGTFALRTLSAGMMAGITSPARPWFRLTVSDTRVAELAAVKAWLYEVEVVLRAIFAKSNLYKALPTLYTELGGFGTGCMVIEEDFENVIRCKTFTVGSYRLAINKDGLADTMYRDAPMTVEQVVDMFGFDACSDSVKQMHRLNQFDQYIDVVHVIEPRRVRNHNLATADQKPIASIWYEKNSRDGKFLRVSGYDENPLVAPRWVVDNADVYGTGPGHDTKGIVKALQIKEKKKAQAIEKEQNPPMTGPESMQGKASSVIPGHITYINSRNGNDGFKPAYQINPRIDHLNLDIQQSEQLISRGFYEDLFLMLANSDRRQITAREIEERHEEKLLMLGPVLERLNDEGLDIIIDRTYSIADRNGLFPPPPTELQGKALKVEYISILAQAQKAVATNGIERLARYVGEVAVMQVNAGVEPDVIDKFDFDQSVDEYSEALGTSPRLVRSDDDVEVRRQARQQAQQIANALAQAQQAATVSRDLSQADTGGKNALTDVLSASQQ